MRWIASLVAEAYRILIRGGVFLYPGDRRAGLRTGPAAAGLRGQPDRLPDRAGRRRRHRQASSRILDIEPEQPAPAHAAGLRLGARGRRASPATTPTRAPSASARRCSAIAACSGPERARPCPPGIPSSRSPARPGAGTTSVQAHLRADFPPREDRGRLHRGRRLPPLRPRRRCATKVAEEEKNGNPNFTHFSAEANVLEELRGGVRGIRPQGHRPHPHTTSTTRRRRSSTARRPAPSPNGATFPADSDLLFYEGLHGCRRHRQGQPRQARRPEDRRRAGDQSRMDPEDPPRPRDARLFHRGGDGRDPAPHAGLRALHLPAVHARPTSISSACRSSTRRTRSSRAGSRRRTNRWWSSASPIRAASISPTCCR